MLKYGLPGAIALAMQSVLPVRAEPVDMLLCLAADVSESVTAGEYDLQKQGHASAIEDAEVVSLIQAGAHGRIAVHYVEWADQLQQYAEMDWQVVADMETARDVANKIRSSALPPWITMSVRNTSTSEVVEYCLRQFQSAPMTARRMVIDISSDGTSNVGARIDLVRDLAVSRGVVINALAIEDSLAPFPDGTHTRPVGGLVSYFEANVVGGPGSFVQSAKGYASFGEMIRRKFILELASLQ